MSGDWRTRTAGLAGCLGEPPHPSVTVTSNTVDYPQPRNSHFPPQRTPKKRGVGAQRVKGKFLWSTYYVPGIVPATFHR